MSYESAAIATQEMKGLSQFRRPVGAIAVLALAAGLSGCGAQEQAQPAESNTGSAAAAGFDSTSYDSWAHEVADGPVWIAPGFVSEKLDTNSGETYAQPLATVKGDPSCSQPGAVKKNPAADVKLYTATHDPKQINEVPQSDINFITTSDGNGVNAVKESGLVVTQCIEFHKSEDNFGAGEVPKEAAFPQPDGTWYRVEIATEHTDGVNGALAANRALNQ